VNYLYLTADRFYSAVVSVFLLLADNVLVIEVVIDDDDDDLMYT